MNEETTNIEKKADQAEPEPKAAELSDKDLDNVAGGSSYNTTKSNVKTNA